MEFRLVFEGSLKSGQAGGRAKEKHAIRKAIHKQLAQLWETVPDLKMRSEEHSILNAPPAENSPRRITMAAATPRGSLWKTLGDNFDKCGFKFVPLVSTHLKLTCGLDILILKKDKANLIGQAGDIDNRLKTLFDALQVPTGCEELGGAKPDPKEKEVPYFFCLTENDCLITDVRVTVDNWLAPFVPPVGLGAAHIENFVHLVMTVRVKPSIFGFDNLAFVT